MTGRLDLQSRAWGLAATAAEGRDDDLISLIVEHDTDELHLLVAGLAALVAHLFGALHDAPPALVAEALRRQALVPLMAEEEAGNDD